MGSRKLGITVRNPRRLMIPACWVLSVGIALWFGYDQGRRIGNQNEISDSIFDASKRILDEIEGTDEQRIDKLKKIIEHSSLSAPGEN